MPHSTQEYAGFLLAGSIAPVFQIRLSSLEERRYSLCETKCSYGLGSTHLTLHRTSTSQIDVRTRFEIGFMPVRMSSGAGIDEVAGTSSRPLLAALQLKYVTAALVNTGSSALRFRVFILHPLLSANCNFLHLNRLYAPSE